MIRRYAGLINFVRSLHTLWFPHRWTDGSPTDFINWGPGEPNDHNGEENCVVLRVRDGEHIISILQLISVYNADGNSCHLIG